jgi:hypothetical protein
MGFTQGVQMTFEPVMKSHNKVARLLGCKIAPWIATTPTSKYKRADNLKKSENRKDETGRRIGEVKNRWNDDISVGLECSRFLVFSKIRNILRIFRKIIFRFFIPLRKFVFQLHFSFFIFRDSFFILHIVARIYDGLLQFLRMKKIPSSRSQKRQNVDGKVCFTYRSSVKFMQKFRRSYELDSRRKMTAATQLLTRLPKNSATWT